MAEPWEEYQQQPAQQEGPWTQYAQPQQGLLAKGIGMLGTPEGRSQLLQGVEKLPADIVRGTLDWFETPGKAVSQGLTSDEEVSFGLNTALGTIGGKTIPRGAPKGIDIPPEVASVAKAFNDTIAEPGATQLAASMQQPSPKVHLQEMTEPGSDDRIYHILDDGGKHVATAHIEVNGSHADIENIHAGDVNPALESDLEKRNELAAQQANTIGPQVIRQALRQFLAENPDIKTIGGKRVSGARLGGGYDIGEGTDIQLNLQQARELGVIGPQDKPSLNELPPKEAGRAAMAATEPPDKIVGGEPGQPEQSEWRARWERTLDRMGVQGDARNVINSVVDANDEFAQARIGDMRPVEIEQLASVTGLDSSKIDVAGTSAKIKNNVELRNTTEAFRIVTDKIKRAAEDLAAKGGVDDEAEIGELTRLELQHDLLLDTTVASKELIALRAEFGRTGNTLNELRKAMAEANGLRDFLKDKRGRSPDDVRQRARLINDTPPESLPKVLQSTRQPQKPGWLFWTWQNGLISGPFTHAKYLAVNTATVYLERVIAPEMAAVIGKMRGDKVSLMAPLMANVGMYRALGDAFNGARAAFKANIRVPLESEIELTKRAVENPELKGAQTPYTQNVGPDWGVLQKVFNEDQLSAAAKVIGMPGRSANFIHTFYKILSERGAASMRAYEAAFNEGAKGEQLTERYKYHLANPTNEALKATIDDAYSGAFMEKLGDKSGTLARALSTNPYTKWMFPFQHIPWNIERMSVKYSPAALFTLLADTKTGAALKGELGHPAQNLAFAKMLTGSAILGYFVDKALSGVATPDYPTDPKDQKTRQRWKDLGIQPNSLQIGDQWVEMNRLGPVGNVARIGANLGSIIRNYKGEDDKAMIGALWNGAMAAVNQVADETGFQTMRNLIDALDGRSDPGRFLAWQAGSFMPFSSLVSQSASFMDPSMRVANEFIAGLKYRIPLVREGELPKRDPVFGEPVPNPGFHAVFRESPVNQDPIKAELDRLHYYPTAPQRTIGHVKLNDEQYDRYEATAGPLVKQMLQNAINSDQYKRMPDTGRAAMVKGLISAGRAQARHAMQMYYPELIQQGIDARTRQISGQ